MYTGTVGMSTHSACASANEVLPHADFCIVKEQNSPKKKKFQKAVGAVTGIPRLSTSAYLSSAYTVRAKNKAALRIRNATLVRLAKTSCYSLCEASHIELCLRKTILKVCGPPGFKCRMLRGTASYLPYRVQLTTIKANAVTTDHD